MHFFPFNFCPAEDVKPYIFQRDPMGTLSAMLVDCPDIALACFGLGSVGGTPTGSHVFRSFTTIDSFGNYGMKIL